MPKNSRKQNNNRGRSASPKSVQQPNKKQNTTQTVEPTAPLPVQTDNSIIENDMEVDNTLAETSLVNNQNKGKEKEVPPSDNVASSSTMNVDDSSDPTENTIATEEDILAFTDSRPLEKFFAFCLLEKYKGGTPQQKIADIIDQHCMELLSFSGVTRGKSPADPKQTILKLAFLDKEERDNFCKVQIPQMDNNTFSPLVIQKQVPFTPELSITVTEIPLDATELRLKKLFSKYGNITRITMETRNLWQRANITFDKDANFAELDKGDGIFLLNDMIRFHRSNLPRVDIQNKSKYSIKLTNLPRNTTARDLLDIGHMTEATAWIVPRARSNYNYLQHAYFYFASAELCDAASKFKELTLNGKKVEWTDSKKKLCAICSSAHHNASNCPKRRHTPKDRNMQQLYQKFQPARFNNYVAPKKQQQRGAVRDNVTFVDAVNNKKKDDQSKGSSSNPPPQSFNNRRNPKPKPLSWADDIPDEMDIETDNSTRVPKPFKDLSNGTVKGGSMHDQDFQKFVTTQLGTITKQLTILTSNLAFSQDRLSVIEKALDINVVTPQDATEHNDALPPESSPADEKYPHIDASKCVTPLQKKTNEQLITICHRQQRRISSFTTAINSLASTCADFQQILLTKGLMSEHDVKSFAPITDTLDRNIESCLSSFPQ